ncbi:MAG: hypothetical protein CL433_08115 [Acidimicrobiaceae bacterium]|nr:hypothetical protein [Acidimicrobiaceae bacterium]HAB56807.1 hypothetical protein [Acidimicrobiaceae bacterium]
MQISDARPDLASALGAAAIGVGLLAAESGRTKLALLGSIVAGAAAALTMSQRRETDTADERNDSMNEQVHELEQALTTQVQRRIGAEEAVKSLSEQLSAA